MHIYHKGIQQNGMTCYKWKILQTVLSITRLRGRIKKGLKIKMCGNDNYCEIVCQLFRASLLLMDLTAVYWKTRLVLIHIWDLVGGGVQGSNVPPVTILLH
jgi:hypothetical protein